MAYAAVHLAAPAAMGAGDVKLAAPLGAVLAAASWAAVVAAGLVAALLSAVLATVMLAMRGRSSAVPHGPSMLVAGLLVVAVAARGRDHRRWCERCRPARGRRRSHGSLGHGAVQAGDDGSVLRWITAGESHGPALVAVLEGMVAGVEITTKG